MSDLGDLGDLAGMIGKGDMRESMETKLSRLLTNQKGPLSPRYIQWLVTGNYPQPQIRFDVVPMREDHFPY